MNGNLTLQVLHFRLAICRLQSDAPVPEWVSGGKFWSVTRTDDECSVICEQDRIPEGFEAERNWMAWKVQGPLDFSMTGILSSLLVPLSDAGISVFALSTYETDYLLIKADRYEDAFQVLNTACTIIGNNPAP
jgi:hypothetical protein